MSLLYNFGSQLSFHATVIGQSAVRLDSSCQIGSAVGAKLEQYILFYFGHIRPIPLLSGFHYILFIYLIQFNFVRILIYEKRNLCKPIMLNAISEVTRNKTQQGNNVNITTNTDNTVQYSPLPLRAISMLSLPSQV